MLVHVQEGARDRAVSGGVERQHDCSGVQKIVWRANMEKIARRNIMAMYEDWRIFRRILKL